MPIDPNTRIGHIHLTVSDLDRALAFYRDILGFEMTSRYGRDAVFLSAGGYPHPIRPNTRAGRRATRHLAPAGGAGGESGRAHACTPLTPSTPMSSFPLYKIT